MIKLERNNDNYKYFMNGICLYIDKYMLLYKYQALLI